MLKTKKTLTGISKSAYCYRELPDGERQRVKELNLTPELPVEIQNGEYVRTVVTVI